MNSGKQVVSAASLIDSMVCGTILAVPLKDTPQIVLAFCSAVAVLALPVKAPTNEVDVTLASPANVVLVVPSAMFVEPIVIELLARFAFAIGVPFQTPVAIVPRVVIELCQTYVAAMSHVVPVTVILLVVPINETPHIAPFTELTASVLSTLSQVVPLNIVQSPTFQSVIPSKFVDHATETT